MNNSKTLLDVTLHTLRTLKAMDLKKLSTNKTLPESRRTAAVKLFRPRAMAKL